MTPQDIMEALKDSARRTGRVPGKVAFAKETGITEGVWSRFWPRYSDLVTGAGLVPNSRPTRIPDAHILKLIAELGRRLRREPTFAELRVEANGNPNWPAFSSITGRFPTKASLVGSLRRLAREDPEFADLAALLPIEPPAASDAGASARRASLGYVYLIRHGANPEFKVGRSDDVGRRFAQLRTQMPQDCVLVHVIETEDPVGIEAYWHKRFAPRRLKGEWFGLTPEDVAAFRRRKFQ